MLGTVEVEDEFPETAALIGRVKIRRFPVGQGHAGFCVLENILDVLVTGHQAFLTGRALQNIAETTLNNLTQFEETGHCDNAVLYEEIMG